MQREEIRKLVSRADLVLRRIEIRYEGLPHEGYEVFDYWEIISDMRDVLFEILEMTNEFNPKGNKKEVGQ